MGWVGSHTLSKNLRATARGAGTPTRRETRATALLIFSSKVEALSTMYRCSWPVQQAIARWHRRLASSGGSVRAVLCGSGRDGRE